VVSFSDIAEDSAETCFHCCIYTTCGT